MRSTKKIYTALTDIVRGRFVHGRYFARDLGGYRVEVRQESVDGKPLYQVKLYKGSSLAVMWGVRSVAACKDIVRAVIKNPAKEAA